MRCRECRTAKGRYEDPRDQPIDEGVCLCASCYLTALDDELDNLEEKSMELTKERNRVARVLNKR